MVRLHLVGFTTDLKNLIFADERGARSGGFVVSVDSRLRHTLEEVARLEEESEAQYQIERMNALDSESKSEPEPEPEPEAPPIPKVPRPDSKLTPKEIQSLLRQGKTEEQVARLAQTPVDWIKRFSFAILAERQDVIDAVKAATLSKPRLGPSGMNIGESVEENIGAKRLRITPQEMEEAWKSVRKNGRWHVTFEYTSRGQKRLARYSFDPSSRMVEPLNEIALELGWRADSGNKPSPNAAPSPRVSGSIVKPTAARSVAGPPRASGVPRQGTRQPAAGQRPAAPRPGAAGAESPPARRPRSTGSASRAPQTGRTPLPTRSVEPEKRSGRSIEPELEDLEDPPESMVSEESDAEPPEAPPADPPRSPASGFIEGKPKPDRPEFSQIPKVWRPTRRP